MAVASNTVPNLEKLYECAQTLSNAKGLVQNRVSHNVIRKIGTPVKVGKFLYRIQLIIYVCINIQYAADYQIILSGVRGDAQTKRLSSQFIARFFTKFPNLANASLDALLDLCEDDDVNIRKQAIKVLNIRINFKFGMAISRVISLLMIMFILGPAFALS